MYNLCFKLRLVLDDLPSLRKLEGSDNIIVITDKITVTESLVINST